MSTLVPRLSIVIVTFNSKSDLDGCLGSIAAQPPAVPFEVVVVDNASQDGTPQAIAERWPDARVIEAGGNFGFSRANNIGIAATAGELVLLLNPDTVVPAGTIDRLVRELDTRADAAIVGPRLVDRDGHAELSFGAMIAPLAELRQKILVTGNDRGIAPIRWLVERRTQHARRVDWVSGACLLIRRRDLDAVGGLDERFFMYTEDVDLCAAVRARGRAVWFVPAATVVHLRGRSVRSAATAVRREYRRSQLAFYAKHHPRWLPWLRRYLQVTGKLPDTTIGR